MVQLSFMQNGNIAPCPFTDKCKSYKVGCQGISYWCKQEFDNKGEYISHTDRDFEKSGSRI